MLKTKDACESKVLPFVKLSLPDKPEGLRLTVYDSKGVKFDVDGCKVKKLTIMRDPESPAKAVLGLRLQVPPMQQTAMSHLNNAVGTEIEIALSQPQLDMEV